MTFRFIHTADWQLGQGFDRFPPDAAAELRKARLEAVARIGRLATQETMDAVLVAGDCFDQIAVADRTLRQFLAAAESFAGPWLLLPGNHDPALAESPWSRLRRIGVPENIIIADRPEPIILGTAAVLPAPLRRRRDVMDLTEWFDGAATPEGAFRIGLAHGSVAEFLPEPGEAMNPVALDRAQRARLDYLALGDWHGLLKVDERTWYSGTPEPDRFKDNGPGHVLKVTLEAPGAPPRVKAERLARITWRQPEFEIAPGGAESFGGRLAELVSGRDTIVKLSLRGVVDLATRTEVSEVIEKAAARVLHLEMDESGLVIEPSDDDLDAIDTAGFVRIALEDLRGRLGGPEGDTALRALAHLYRLHLQAGD